MPQSGLTKSVRFYLTTTTILIEQTTNYHIFLSEGSSRIASETLRQWYAPGIGPVKISGSKPWGTARKTQTSELIGYNINGIIRGIQNKFTIADELSVGNSDTGTPGKPGIGTDGTNFLVVTYREAGSPEGLIGILLSPEGQILSEFTIAPFNGPDTNPAVTYDGTNYLVVYCSNPNIKGVRVSTNGNVIDSEGGFQISTGQMPSVIFDGTQSLVVWHKYTGLAHDIYGCFVSPDAQVSPEFCISDADYGQGFVALASGDSNSLAVWVDDRNYSNTTDYHEDIYGARISTNGDVLDPEGIPIAIGATSQTGPKVAFDGNNYLVVYQDDGNTIGKRINPNGTLLDGSPETHGIEINTTKRANNHAVAFDGNNYFVALTVGVYASKPPAGIYAARITPSGNLLDIQPDSIGLIVAGPPPDYSKLTHATILCNGINSLLIRVVNIEHGGFKKWIEGNIIYPF